MKKPSHLLRTTCSLFLILCMLLCGCPAPSEGGGTTTTTTTSGGTDPNAPTPTVYPNATPLAGMGDSLAADAPVLRAPVYDESAATVKSAAEVTAAIRSQANLKAGDVFLVSDGLTVVINGTKRDRSYADVVVIAPGGLTIKAAENCTVSDLTVIGSLSLEGCENLTLKNVKVVADGATAISVDAASKGVILRDCYLSGGVALDSRADGTCVLDSFLTFTETGIADAAPTLGVYVRGCRLSGSGTAIKTAGESAEIRENTITVGASDTAIAVGAGQNILIAENIIRDAQTGISLVGVNNAAVVRNALISLRASNTAHTSLADNLLGGKLYASDNRYLLANGNTSPDDGYDHKTESVGNTNPTGDSLLDVNRRLSVGADETLLPQVDRDRFTYMARKEYVRDPDGDERVSDYIQKRACEQSVVIVAPGAYHSYSTIKLRAAHKNTTVYAYGVYTERVEEGATDNGGTAHYHAVDVDTTENITIKGLTTGLALQSSGQAYIVGFIKNEGKAIAIAGAGLYNELGATNPEMYYSGTLFGYREGEMKPYADLPYSKAEHDGEGRIIITFNTSASHERAAYEQLRVGDVVSCRAQGVFAAVNTHTSSGIVYEDLTAYAASGGVGFAEYETVGVVYHRVVDTSQPGKLISKEIYDKYKALEAQYGISFDVYTDGEHYRGCPMRIGSVDGLHTINTVKGSQVTSSIFENMADDGTNQHGGYSRLSYIKNNGDGTATVCFKGNLTQVGYNKSAGPYTPNSWGRFPDKGNEVFIYSLGNGEVLCDGVALTKWEADGTRTTVEWGTEVCCYTFTVAADTVDWALYQSFVDRGVMDDPDDRISRVNMPDETYKVAVENSTYMCDGGYFDNCLVQNTRSRGFLIKASNVTIENCTFRYMAAAISVRNEGGWGEASYSRNLVIKNNLIDHTGYRGDAPTNSPITIVGVGAESSLDLPLDKLLTGDILIEGNVIRNRCAKYAVNLQGVENVRVINNDFGKKNTVEGLSLQRACLHIEQVKNVTVEGNTYPDATMMPRMTVTANRYIGLGGADLGNAFPDAPTR